MTYEEREEERQKILEKKARGEKLTIEETRLANMNMIKPGEVRNPNGRKKGSINWSTRIRRLMNDEAFLKSVIKSLPNEWSEIVDGTPADVIGASMIASVVREAARSVVEGKPLDAQTLKTIDRISKIGYGDKITLDVEEGSVFTQPVINFEVVDSTKKNNKS